MKPLPNSSLRTHARTHARHTHTHGTHTHTHTRARARTRTHVRTHTHATVRTIVLAFVSFYLEHSTINTYIVQYQNKECISKIKTHPVFHNKYRLKQSVLLLYSTLLNFFLLYFFLGCVRHGKNTRNKKFQTTCDAMQRSE